MHHSPMACPTCARVCRTAAIDLALVLAAGACWFLVRRLSGAFTTAPSGLVLLGTSLVLALGAGAVRWLGRLDEPFFATPVGRAVWLTPTLSALFLGLAVATFPASGLGIAVFWIVVALSEAAAWLRERRELLALWQSLAAPARAVPPPADSTPEVAEEQPAPLPENVMLQFSRSRTSRGEVISGAARAEFETGQRVATLHVPFGAPLAGVPEVLVEALADDAVEIQCAQALPHGVRFDLRLARPAAQPTAILFAFEAHAPLSNTAAA